MDQPIPIPLAKLRLPVEVIGADLHGQQFFTRTRTVTIQRNGVSIFLANKLGPESEVILRNPETNEEAVAFVSGQTSEGKTGYVYSLDFPNPSANPWRKLFPAAEAVRVVQLECSGCHSVSTLSLSDIEWEIFEANRELTRPCNGCHSLTTWRETSREPLEKPSTSLRQNLNPSAIASPKQERRKNRRAGMKAAACIRFSGSEIVVACEDISKGGFRFASSKKYSEGTRVEAAVPYTKSSTNIFISARIIYCHKMPDGQFRHGVSYIH